ncbi:MAG TPA: GNAT family N-acetyltransferase [Candidatus Marinimicrobia bacterium]|nr:GNAT family N-acetyltransferase [Candidatus Neomarinimicrobiota bacterium]
MIKILNVKEYKDSLDEGIRYIHGKWGNNRNYTFYEDAIRNASSGNKLPQFYLMLKSGRIIGCAALLTNDYISRQDLYPWVGCLFVEKNERGNEYGKHLLEHAIQKARLAGFPRAYLTTDHDSYYEKYGWIRIEDGIDLFSSQPSRIYYHET